MPTKKAESPTPEATPSLDNLTFEAVDEIDTTRPRKPNPFTDMVKKLPVGSRSGISFTVPVGVKRSTVNNQLDQAAEEANVTVRRIITENADGTQTFTVRAIPRVVRKRKGDVNGV